MKAFDKTKIKLASFDVDGTIYLDGPSKIFDSGCVSEAVGSAIRRIAQTGVITVLATGRPHHAMPTSVLEVGAFRYAVCNGGAIVWDYEKEDAIVVYPFDREIVRVLVEALPSLVPNFGLAFERKHDNHPGQWLKLTQEQRMAETIRIFNETGDNVLKITCRFPDHEECELAAKRIGESFPVEVYVPEHRMCEITPAGVHKGGAFTVLCEHLGVEPSEIVAFGDSVNDLEVFRLSGYAVVMASGQEPAKQAADYICPSYQEDGIAHAIGELFGI